MRCAGLEAYATLLSSARHYCRSATSFRVDTLETLLYRDDFEVFFAVRDCIWLNTGIERRKTTASFRCQTKQIEIRDLAGADAFQRFKDSAGYK